MYNIEKIEKNICLELGHLREELDDDQYQQLMNDKKLVINFENNEVFTMEKNSYLNPQDERINNIEYFSIPNHSDIDNLLNNENNSLSRAIEEHYENIIEEQKIDLAQNSTNRELLKILAKENDEDINYKLIGNENTPLEVLKYLSSDDIYKDALNENYSFKKYDELMNDEDFSKRQPIQQETIIKMFRLINDKEDISINLYKIFIDVNYEPLLHEMVSYEKTPPEILNELYNSKSKYIYHNDLAKNPNCPQNILEEYAETGGLSMKETILSNKNCPKELFEKLSEEVIREKKYKNMEAFEISDYKEPSYDFDR